MASSAGQDNNAREAGSLLNADNAPVGGGADAPGEADAGWKPISRE